MDPFGKFFGEQRLNSIMQRQIRSSGICESRQNKLQRHVSERQVKNGGQSETHLGSTACYFQILFLYY